MIVESVEVLQSELIALRQQIAVLEQSVGEAQQREAASRAGAERLLFLCEAASEAIVIQERGRVTDANHVVPQMFGYPHDEIIGMDVMTFIAPESRARTADYLRLQADKLVDIVGQRKDGSTFPIEATVRTIRGHELTKRVAIIQDITERKRAEAERAELQETIIQSQEMALAELSTPLIPISDHVMVMP